MTDDSSDWEFVFATPKAAPSVAPKGPRYPSLFQVSSHSMPTRTSPNHAFASVHDLSSSVPASAFEPPTSRAAPVSVGDLKKSALKSAEPCPFEYRPTSLSTPKADLALSPLSKAPPVPRSSGDHPPTSAVTVAPNPDSFKSRPAPTGPTRFSHTKSQTQTRIRQPSNSKFLLQKWHSVLAILGSLSQLSEACSKSNFGYQHADRILDSLAPSTAMQYLTTICHFLQLCRDLGCELESLNDVTLADLLLVISLSRRSDASGVSRASTIKAIRWLRRQALVDCLQCAYSPLVDSFLKVKKPRDKKEAAPLPLWVLIQWERRILQAACTQIETLVLGSFLFMAFSGLRYADLQRIDLTSLVWSRTEVRGLCWRSKTQTHGHPFGLVSSGFLSKGDHTWLWKFLTVLDGILSYFQPSSPDFLLPDCSFHAPDFIPMSYPKALQFLRIWLHAPWCSSPSPMHKLELNYTMHSLKATFLSWGPQLHGKVSDDQRLQQGHHSDPRQSLRLYGRDSVWGALSFQRQVIQEVHQGFRPKIAQHRGGQTPLTEPPVQLDLYRKDLPAFEFTWFKFDEPEQALDPVELETVESSSASSSDSSSSTSDEQVLDSVPKKAKVVKTPASTPDECLMGRYRSVIHALILSQDDFDWRPEYSGHRLKAACGRNMKGQETALLSEWDSQAIFCQHPGCRKIWASLDMD